MKLEQQKLSLKTSSKFLGIIPFQNDVVFDTLNGVSHGLFLIPSLEGRIFLLAEYTSYYLEEIRCKTSIATLFQSRTLRITLVIYNRQTKNAVQTSTQR